MLAEEFNGWAPYLVGFVPDSTCAPVLRPIHALPVDHASPCKPGITLLGDAAHLVSPFAGKGANLAMFDGAELGSAMAADSGDLGRSLECYEHALFPYSRCVTATSARNLSLFMGEDAPRSAVTLFE